MKILNFFHIQTRTEDGAAMLEYALMAALIAIVSIAAVGAMGREVENTFNVTATEMQAAANFPGAGNPGMN